MYIEAEKNNAKQAKCCDLCQYGSVCIASVCFSVGKNKLVITHANTHTHTHTHLHTPTHTLTHLHTPTHIHLHTYTHTHTPTYTYTHTHTHLHTPTHTHTHTHHIHSYAYEHTHNDSLHLSINHDPNSGAESISFLHVVRGENSASVLALKAAADHVPVKQRPPGNLSPQAKAKFSHSQILPQWWEELFS